MQWVQHSKIAVVLVEFLLVALVLYIGAKVLTAENPLPKLQGNTLWGFVCGSGLFLLPIAWVVGVIRPKTYLETPKHLVILVAACYCVVVYSAFCGQRWNSTIIMVAIWHRLCPLPPCLRH